MLYRSDSVKTFDEITISVPTNPYGLRKPETSVGSDGEEEKRAHSDKYLDKTDENSYLSPGCPVAPKEDPIETRFRKISSPARTKFFQPDKDILAKFNARCVLQKLVLVRRIRNTRIFRYPSNIHTFLVFSNTKRLLGKSIAKWQSVSR